MAKPVIHISELEASRDFAALLARVRSGVEVVIERDNSPVAIVRSPAPLRRTISECVALLPEHSTGVVDEDFAKDLQAAVESHREALDSPWE
jgi:antitoxin (DNA-binding transcriptional repressor) of toxin-antitoxin stability system